MVSEADSEHTLATNSLNCRIADNAVFLNESITAAPNFCPVFFLFIRYRKVYVRIEYLDHLSPTGTHRVLT